MLVLLGQRNETAQPDVHGQYAAELHGARTVSERRAVASNTTRKDRIKARANEQIEPWMVFSPKNRAAVVEAARRVFQEGLKRLVVQRWLGKKQN